MKDEKQEVAENDVEFNDWCYKQASIVGNKITPIFNEYGEVMRWKSIKTGEVFVMKGVN